MKQQKMTGYTPKYPRRVIQGAALTAAAVLALSATGCKSIFPVTTSGAVALPTDDPGAELVLDGEVAVDPGAELVLDGEVAVDPGEELILDGEEMADETALNSFDEIATTGIVYVPEE